MKKQLIVVDDFYTNPDDVRDFALSQEFNVTGNYPGQRTEQNWNRRPNESIFSTFQKLLGEPLEPWNYEKLGYSSSFQITTETDETWIHTDETDWAAVIYLTPNAPHNSGTAFYSIPSIDLRERQDRSGKDFDNKDPGWVKSDVVSNVYNRLVLYSGYLYHRSDLPGFGTDKYSGRLFQTFFFNSMR